MADNIISHNPASFPSPSIGGPPPAEEQNIISLRNLQFTDPILAPTIFNELKPQPATVSIQIHLREPFLSTAQGDMLDDSTVHYGQLAKNIRSACAKETGETDVLFLAAREAFLLASKDDIRKNIASRIAAELLVPKASAYGDGLSLSWVRCWDDQHAGHMDQPSSAWYTFSARRVRVPTLIGVNAYERKGKQPLIIDLGIDFEDDESTTTVELMQEVFPLERRLVEIVEPTTFDTLETLTEHTLERLREVVRGCRIRPYHVHLRFEKPAAVPFADGPVIEVHRKWA